MHVPLVVRGPKFKPGTVRSDLVEQIDLAATSLALAGIPKPAAMQARDLLADNYEPRRYVFSARDRADETVDRIRAVRSERHKYIRNFYPEPPVPPAQRATRTASRSCRPCAGSTQRASSRPSRR